MDRLSNLSDDLLLIIISLLPTHIAARTSVLSRRFRHLWEGSPSLKFISQDIPHPQCQNFVDMADCALLHRNPSLPFPLVSLRLDLPSSWYFTHRGTDTPYFVCSLLSKACSLHLRHLTIRNLSNPWFESVLPVIFSISTLNSLSLGLLPHGDPIFPQFDFPSGITLTFLRSLSLTLRGRALLELGQLLSEMYSLENLHLKALPSHQIQFIPLDLSSKSIGKLKLIICTGFQKLNSTAGLFLPSLESLHLILLSDLSRINGDVPLLRKAKIVLEELEHVNTAAELLNCISHVEVLSMRIKESKDIKHPTPILFEAEKHMLNFPNLKHLHLTACFHKYNFEAVVSIFHHSPVLESLNLFHEIPVTYRPREREREKIGDQSYHVTVMVIAAMLISEISI